MVNDNDCDILDYEQAMKFLKVGKTLLTSYVVEDRIPHRHMGRRVLFSRQALIRWVEEGDSPKFPAISGGVLKERR